MLVISLIIPHNSWHAPLTRLLSDYSPFFFTSSFLYIYLSFNINEGEQRLPCPSIFVSLNRHIAIAFVRQHSSYLHW